MHRFRFRFQESSQKDLEVLRRAGFDLQEISRLCRLRKKYQPKAQDQPVLSQNHLRFTRWLVQQGKLNEGPC